MTPGSEIREAQSLLVTLQGREARQRQARALREAAVQDRLGTLTASQRKFVNGQGSATSGATTRQGATKAMDGEAAGSSLEALAEEITPLQVDSEGMVTAPDLESTPPDCGASTTFSYRGATATAAIHATDIMEVAFAAARELFDLPSEAFTLKLVYKGKVVSPQASAIDVLGPQSFGGADASHAQTDPKAKPTCTPPSKPIMVMASAREAVATVQATKSDSSVASFAAEHGSRKGGGPKVVGVRQGKMRR